MSAAAPHMGSGPNFLAMLFTEDFDLDPDPPAEAEPAAPTSPAPSPAPAPPPPLTQADLDAAREDGRRAGRLEAEHGLAAARNRILQQIADGMAATKEDAARVVEEATNDIGAGVLRVLSTMLPVLCERYGEGEIRGIIQSLEPVFCFEPRITIRVHPAMAASVRDEVDRFEPELAARAQIVPTETVAKGDLYVRWAEGKLVRDAGQVRRAVERALANIGMSAEPMILEKEAVDA